VGGKVCYGRGAPTAAGAGCAVWRTGQDAWSWSGFDLVHWNGTSWERYPKVPYITTLMPGLAGELWAGDQAGSLYRRTGPEWTPMPSAPRQEAIVRVQVLADSVTFLSTAKAFYRRDGQIWTKIPEVPPGKFWAAGASDVWQFVNAGSGFLAARRWNGTGMVDQPLPVAAQEVRDFWSTSPSNVWITTLSPTQLEQAWRWDGAAWHDETPPGGAVWFCQTEEIGAGPYVIGVGHAPRLHQRTGTTWKSWETGLGLFGTCLVERDGTIWVSGGNGDILRRNP